MNKKISELFDYGDEIVVNDKIGIVLDPEEIKELTMKKIRENETMSVNNKKRLSRGVVAVIVAAACLALCGAGYAAGLFRQQYNWRGEAVGELHPGETMVSQDKVIELHSLSDAETVQAILDDRKDRELVIVRDANGEHFSQRSESVSSVDELREKLKKENSPLRVPYEIPAGYTLTNAYVAYESTGGYALTSAETCMDGLVVNRYSAPPENDFISYYRMDYENGEGDRIFVFARMTQETAYGFSAITGETMKAITVAEMDEALLRTSAESASISMLQYLDEPIDYKDAITLLDKGETDPYTEVYYMLNATNADGDTLIDMLKS